MKTPIAYTETMRLAYSLRHPEDWARVIGEVRGRSDRAAIEGLIELLHRPPSARAAIAAVDALQTCPAPAALDALYQALKSPHVSVRLAALRCLKNRNAFTLSPVVSRMLESDPSWLIRRAAVEFLAGDGSELRWEVLKAGTDPHWRVRHALLHVLLDWSEMEVDRDAIRHRLSSSGMDARTDGLLKYLEYRWTGQLAESVDLNSEDPASWCGFWDWDPAVLAWRMEQMSVAERKESLPLMSHLIGHEDERVRRLAALALSQDGDVPEFLEALRFLDDPRHPAFETLISVADRLDWERKERLAQGVFSLEQPSPGQFVWALGQIGESIDPEDIKGFGELCARAAGDGPRERSALARMLSRLNPPETRRLRQKLLRDPHPDVVIAALEGEVEYPAMLPLEDWQRLVTSNDPEIRAAAAGGALAHDAGKTFLPQLVQDPFSPVRLRAAEWLGKQEESLKEHWLPLLQSDESSLIRASALMPARAEELIKDPRGETSWLVLERAARLCKTPLCKTPLWKIAPEPLPDEPAPKEQPPAVFTISQIREAPRRRLVGRPVSALGISGHYGLPVEGFAKAMEAGVNLLFWEPNYQTLTDFMQRFAPSERCRLHLVAGTFEASPERIRNDVERALAKLQIEQIAVFVLFWTRSWNRITDDVRGMLDQLQHAGKIGGYGLSTHSRPLAVEAIETGWNPVMVRHSAAHRGAETAIFPKASERGMSLLTFNNTCYGRLLEAFPAGSELSAADCYRYTLSFDAVTACWSAPATIEELETNLEALASPELSKDKRERLRGIGRRVYEEDTIFRQRVRGA